ncbi:right-handed parallel beta-helix repeat-containing protein [Candidatus Viridilinea mediisalina]|uniref:Right handed beta helix domain-containing protein n=1 Tax=Candidatus Viridilinea mediisalina TaxID=2024553 RepID=A0A2A6RH23_9CHLR|nr:right-handed parallel beta-helix repeat-containing protein [Candidatus Viridilinea mediisalina]PDW02175.1 hypothetical protein CJ255_15300 [Candidatus Viridilinea mediisalina]
MSDDAQQQPPPAAPSPDDEPTQQGTKLSRDTLLLLGALVFLIFAVALTFMFTPGATPPPDEPTSVADVPTLEVTPDPDADDPGPYPEPGDGTPTTTVAAYPGPDLLPTGDPSLEPSLTPTDAVAGGVMDPSEAITPTVVGAYPEPVGEGTPPPLPTFSPDVTDPLPTPAPTPMPLPTAAPPPTMAPTPMPIASPTPPAPTLTPSPTEERSTSDAEEPSESDDFPFPDDLLDTDPFSPTLPFDPEPGPPPADVLEGNVRWNIEDSPIILEQDVQIPPGSQLLIEPGVEVQLDAGVSIYVDGGRLLAMGLPDRPVRFVGTSRARWSGIFGRPESFIVLEHSDIRGGGVGGTVMAVERSELVIRDSRFNDNGGAILLHDTRLEMRNSEVAANDMPFGPALEVSYGRGNFVTMVGNRFGGNRMAEGAPQVRISNSSTFETVNLAIEGNLIRGGSPNLQLSTNGPLRGEVICNSLVGDAMGFSLRTRTPQVAPHGLPPMALRIEHNLIDEHVPPIIPVYLEYGLGRGATSAILLDMRNNWWGDSSGPYDPEDNQLGRGDSAGVNIIYAPWLTAPPACAPAN